MGSDNVTVAFSADPSSTGEVSVGIVGVGVEPTNSQN